MFGDHLFGQFKQRGFVAFFGHLNQGAFLVFRQAAELAQFAVADAHAGHGFQGFFAEGGKIGNIQIGFIRRYSEQLQNSSHVPKTPNRSVFLAFEVAV
jgi:hypothetical protein